MLIRDLGVLLGPDLDHVQGTDVQIRRGKFRRIGPGIRPGRGEETADGGGLIMIPGFINAHTHIGDSVGKDVAIDATVDERIHPVAGIKSQILNSTPAEILEAFMRNSCRSMLRKGITTFVDFREGGPDGVLMLKRALSGVPIRSVILGRADFYQDARAIKDNAPFPKEAEARMESLLSECDGLGVSGANENSDAVLRRYSRTQKLRAIHSSETKQSVFWSKTMAGRSETRRALLLRPHFLVHMTHASKHDLRKASKKVRGLVVCPRANSALAEGIPDVEAMRDAGCTLALGTDNVMVNSPDMFREMDYLWKATMGMRKRRMDPREILKMATVNGGRILRRDIGVVQTGKAADCIFLDAHSLDLEPMHNPHAAIVHRASESSIRAVMVGGEIVHGRL